jgi:hypothetical protein
MFSVYGGKCLSRKAVHNWAANVSLMMYRLQWRCRSGWDTVKRLLCCGFRRTGKAMGQVYLCWWRICREINVFRFEYHMFYVLYPFVTFLLALPCTWSYHGVDTDLVYSDISHALHEDVRIFCSRCSVRLGAHVGSDWSSRPRCIDLRGHILGAFLKRNAFEISIS